MKNKKNNREKRTLIAGLCLSTVFVAGATFAWLTSTDEVTNRLSADNTYNVSITEDFTPPSDWTPGQEITKKVNAVNTGNVDSLVRLSFGHAFSVTNYGEGINTSATDLTKAIEIDSAAAKAAQAGGYMVYSGSAAVESGNAVNAGAEPQTADGLYVFRRQISISKTGDTTTTTYEYDGYYVKGGKYYAIDVPTKDDGTADIDNVKIRTKGDEVVALDSEDTVSYELVTAADSTGVAASTFANAKALRVTYDPDSAATGDEIVVYAAFADDAQTYYTYNTTEQKFYYNSVLIAGSETTSPLIKSVTLGTETQANAYLHLDYDLNVKLESIQASKNEAGAYTNETAQSWWANSTISTESATNGTVTWGGSSAE